MAAPRPIADSSFSVDEDFTGFGLGIGAEHQFPGYPLAVRLEATRIEYSSKDTRVRRRLPNLMPVDDDISIEPAESTVNLQLVFRF